MYEAYQYIIRVQVEYLIKLGINDALKVSHSLMDERRKETTKELHSIFS